MPEYTTLAASPWPSDLDALMAAPGQHRLVLENDRVRVLDTQIAPGECTAMHTHPWPAVHHVLRWSEIVRRDEAGVVTFDSRTQRTGDATGGATGSAPTTFWGEPLGPHTLENVGTTQLRIISVEVKG